jgi:hypothetical protein
MRGFLMAGRCRIRDAAAMPDYRCAKVPGGAYFFTVAIPERRSSLLTDHIDDLCYAFRVALSLALYICAFAFTSLMNSALGTTIIDSA